MAVTYAVENIMSENLVSVDVGSNLSDAVRVMVEKEIGSVLVSQGREIVGILTERDVLKRFCLDARCAEIPVAEVMSRPLISIEGQAAIGRAADLMAGKKVRRLLVTLGGEIRGIVTERDILRSTLYVFKTLSDAAI
jgi:CBS domain-containing protein